MRYIALRFFILSALLLILFSQAVYSHPHAFTETTITFVFDDQGLKEIRSEWQQDSYSSADLVASVDKDRNKELSPEETRELAQTMAEELLPFDYFTYIKVDGEPLVFDEVCDVTAAKAGSRVWLWITLPCEVEAREEYREVRVDQLDPEYYVAFNYSPLRYRVKGGESFDYKLFEEKREENSYFSTEDEPEGLVLRFRQKSPGEKTIAAPVSAATSVASSKPAGEVEQTASGHQAKSGQPQSKRNRRRILSWLAARQKALQSRMEALLSSGEGNRPPLSALFLLCAIAFIYGVVHAAGPGHGKVIAASWLAGGNQRYVTGVALGSLLALFHGLSGIAVVLVGRYVLERTAMATMGEAEKPLKIFSFALIAALGVFLITKEISSWIKGKKMEHAHSGAEEKLMTAIAPPAGNAPVHRGWGPMIFIALAAGLVPCPGVVLVMLFCTALGQTLTGLLLAVCVILGMSLTISVAGMIVIALRKAALYRGHPHSHWMERTERVFRLAGGVLVFVIGMTFLYVNLAG